MNFQNLIPFRWNLGLSMLLRNQYLSMWNVANVAPTPAAQTKVKQAYDRLMANKTIYEQIVADLGNPKGIPWYLVGCIHMRECSFRLDQHLANGDSLRAKTVRVPAGIPVYNLRAGQTAYTFREAAVQAILLKTRGFVNVNRNFTPHPVWANGLNDDSIESLLAKLESFNGFGYLNNNRISPYLWSDSTIEQRGKYTSDGKFNPNVKDQQLGAGTLLKYYLEEEKKKQTPNFSNLFNTVFGSLFGNWNK